MEGFYEELEEAKAEIEKLGKELNGQVELSEKLKKSHNEQLTKAHEASLKIEKQGQEINEKAEEISMLKQMLEEIQGSLNEKESVVKHLRAANEKLRTDCDYKVKKWEEENKGLILALEDANGKSFDQEQRIQVCKEEIEGLKGCLLVSQKKCLEAEKKANRTNETKAIEDTLLSLEQGKLKIEEKLKWKAEQFSHLEEAHRKMKDQFKAVEKEWESEKSSLLAEICSLQTKLDSKIRMSKDLQTRLQMCNQALAREETQRKSLEVQLSDVQGQFENIFGDYQDAKFQLECMNEKRDREIASLRHSLGKKETVLKEIEYQKRQVDQENDEMRLLLKEFQESQIQKASGSPSAAKLRNKLKCSEQIHRESVANLKDKEAELKSQLENMTRERNDFGSQLEMKDEMINALRVELKQARDDSMDLGAKEAEMKFQMENVKNDLNNCKTELESRDAVIEELGMALENFQAREFEWKSRLETTMSDVKKKYMSQLESKDKMITDLGMELEQVHEDYLGKLGAKEAETSSQLEEVTNDLSNYRSLLESRDSTMKELEMELEQVRCDFATQFQAQEDEWKSQAEWMKDDLKNYKSQLERNDQAIKELKMELVRQNEKYRVNLSAKEAEGITQLEKLTGDLDYHRSLLESKGAKIKALEVELEQVQGDFTENLKTKEAEWTYQLEMMANKYRSELDDKDARIKELGMDLESCQSLILQLKLQNEEISVMLLVLNNGVFDAQLNLANEKAEMDRINKEREENVSVLKQNLETKNADIDRLQKDLDRHEQMLMESSICELFLKEQIPLIESALKKKLKKVGKELERANTELAEKIFQGNGAEFELYIWKSIAEHFKVGLEESFRTRKELEASLLAQVIFGETVEQKKRSLVYELEERDERIVTLQQQVVSLEKKAVALEQESLRRELEEFLVAKIGAERRVENEKEKVNDLTKAVKSLESKLRSSLTSFSSQLAEKQEEINLACEKFAAIDQLKKRLKNSDALIEDLKNERRNMVSRVTELSSGRENILGFVGGLDDRIGELSSTDENLMNMLKSIVLSCDDHCLREDLSVDAKENVDGPTTTGKFEVNSDMRSPFREINHQV